MYVCAKELIKRVKMAGDTGFNNSLLCKANDIEGVNSMCTDKETVKTKWEERRKSKHSKPTFKKHKQNTKLSLSFILFCYFILFIFSQVNDDKFFNQAFFKTEALSISSRLVSLNNLLF